MDMTGHYEDVERVLNRDTDTDQSRPAYERVNVLISELDRLRAENARYVEALEDLIYQVEHTKGTDVICLEQAKAALSDGGDGCAASGK
jgi:hypothetical protein